MTDYKLHDSTGHWIARVFSAMRREFDKTLKANGVTISEWAVLAALCQEEVTTPSQIADVAGIDRAVATRVLDKLTNDKKFTLRELNPGDRRSFSIRLTKSGKQMARKLLLENQRINDEFLSGIDRKERIELRKHLQKILENMPH